MTSNCKSDNTIDRFGFHDVLNNLETMTCLNFMKIVSSYLVLFQCVSYNDLKSFDKPYKEGGRIRWCKYPLVQS